MPFKGPGPGRPKGLQNKATRDIKALAGQYTEEALKTLVSIMNSPTAENASRVAAARDLLDRAHGKPTQTVAGDKDAPLVIKEVVRRIVGS